MEFIGEVQEHTSREVGAGAATVGDRGLTPWGSELSYPRDTVTGSFVPQHPSVFAWGLLQDHPWEAAKGQQVMKCWGDSWRSGRCVHRGPESAKVTTVSSVLLLLPPRCREHVSEALVVFPSPHEGWRESQKGNRR